MSELGLERVEIFRVLGYCPAVAHALDEVGVYEYMAGRYDRAERLYAESRALAEELDDRKLAAAVLHSVGVLAQCRGDFAGAREALLDSLARLREVPAEDSEPILSGPRAGPVRRGRGRRGARRGCTLRRPSLFFRRVDARRAIGYVLAALGDVARAQGFIEPARERLPRVSPTSARPATRWAPRSR